MEVSTKRLSAPARTLLALMPLYFGERLAMVVASKGARKHQTKYRVQCNSAFRCKVNIASMFA